MIAQIASAAALNPLGLTWRVYPPADVDGTAEPVLAVWHGRKKVRGLKMTFEPKYLHFFQARFERL